MRGGRRINYLNPNAPEFHPFSTSSTTNNVVTNFNHYNYNYYCHNYYNNNVDNFPYFYSSAPPPSLPPSTQLPHHQFGQNFMQLQSQPQLCPHHPAHFSSALRSPVRPKSRVLGRVNGGARRGSRTNNNDGRWLRSRQSLREKFVVIRVKPNGSETTAMIRNIPNQYTREMLIRFLDDFCRVENQKHVNNDDHQPALAFDFVYLPIDFVRRANKGYAFVNFTHPTAVWKLHLACSYQTWEYFKSRKICKINCATIQGKESLVEHFGKSRFLCNHEEYLPVCFSPPRDGSGASVAETTVGSRISPHHHIPSSN